MERHHVFFLWIKLEVGTLPMWVVAARVSPKRHYFHRHSCIWAHVQDSNNDELYWWIATLLPWCLVVRTEWQRQQQKWSQRPGSLTYWWRTCWNWGRNVSVIHTNDWNTLIYDDTTHTYPSETLILHHLWSTLLEKIPTRNEVMVKRVSPVVLSGRGTHW